MMHEEEAKWKGVRTIRLDVWQFMQDWVVRLRRRFLWSPLSVVEAVESERGRFEPAAVAGMVDMIAIAKRTKGSHDAKPRATYNGLPLPGRQLMPT